jgi:Icc-related predicted phosphoesterase
MASRNQIVNRSKAGKPLIIVCIADTHDLHRELPEVPAGDILVHAGDFTMFSRSSRAILDFNSWLGELPHRHKIVVPGNHEFFLEADPGRRSMLDNAIVLINEGVEIEGLHIWGSPITPLYGGAFGMSAAEDRRKLYSAVPGCTEVLISHGPPWGVLDSAPGESSHSGDSELLEAVKRIRPKLHVFGHIHAGHGVEVSEKTVFVNASLLGEDGSIGWEPIVLKLPRR